MKKIRGKYAKRKWQKMNNPAIYTHGGIWFRMPDKISNQYLFIANEMVFKNVINIGQYSYIGELTNKPLLFKKHTTIKYLKRRMEYLRIKESV